MNGSMNRFIVVDAPPGEGKTTYFINMMEASQENKKYVFVTPFLDETERIRISCPSKNFQLPNNKNRDGSKSIHLEELLEAEENVSITHALFKNMTPRAVELIRRSGKYILVLDEVFDALTEFDLYEDKVKWQETKKRSAMQEDMQWLIDREYIEIEDDYKIVPKIKSFPLGKYTNFWNAVQRGSIFYSRHTLLYNFIPFEMFKDTFNEMYLLTYQFEYSTMSSFFRYIGIPCSLMSVIGQFPNYELVEYKSEYSSEWKKSILSRIRIVDHKINDIGNPYLARKNLYSFKSLSNNWYIRSRNEEQRAQMSRNIRNFFERISGESGKYRLWTTYKVAKKELSGNGVSGQNWLAMNTRATNDYRHKRAIAYPINRFMNPYLNGVFGRKSIPINEDGFAVAETIQFLLRSRLRDGKEVDLYIPSFRMRELLLSELKSESLDKYKDRWFSGGAK